MATRFYFHAATNSATGLPTAEQCSLTADKNMEGSQTTNRLMNRTAGVSQASVSGTPFSTSQSDHYFTRFVSEPLNEAALTANTWTYNFSSSATTTSANFPVDSLGGTARLCCYVWRPSSTSKVGNVLDGTTGAQVSQPPAATQKAHQTTFSGSAVGSMVAGDVIVFEVWFVFDPSASGGSDTCAFYYDGTTVNTTNNATVSNHASFLETPENLVFLSDPIAMTESSAKSYSNKFITKV